MLALVTTVIYFKSAVRKRYVSSSLFYQLEEYFCRTEEDKDTFHREFYQQQQKQEKLINM